ncbi:hypothetical protein GCM10025867_16790 [Frondihabitans sucicola]|uniref:Uncharacterized protein n=1 Tax=Frondihabitans sucicola TaxID=1268041 RepID=A0ABM8GM44_9MICO|nr:hypothetical protein GCM10025867_16790 [Frondihabitans sucicola]
MIVGAVGQAESSGDPGALAGGRAVDPDVEAAPLRGVDRQRDTVRIECRPVEVAEDRLDVLAESLPVSRRAPEELELDAEALPVESDGARGRDDETVDHAGHLLRGLGRGHRPRSGARDPGAPQAEVETLPEQACQRAERLRHLDRAVVAENGHGRAEPDGIGRRAECCQQSVRCRSGDARVEVVLCQPVPRVSGSLGSPRQIDGGAQRLRRAAPGGDRDEVEDGERYAGHCAAPTGVRTSDVLPGTSGGRSRFSRSVAPSSYDVR